MTRPIHTTIGIYRCVDNQPEMLPRIRAERRRRAAYAGCERAPFNWEKSS